jgi:hypothetical protein
MRTLISALAMAGVFAFSLAAYAADEDTVKAPNKPKIGRAIDEGTVKSGGNLDKPGRAIDSDSSAGAVKAPNKPKIGRAIDDGAVKSGPVEKVGRAIDDGAVKSGPVDKPGRAIDDGKVKSGGNLDKPGRAVDEQQAPKKKSKKAKKPQS